MTLYNLPGRHQDLFASCPARPVTLPPSLARKHLQRLCEQQTQVSPEGGVKCYHSCLSACEAVRRPPGWGVAGPYDR